jgi:hypothetical protein
LRITEPRLVLPVPVLLSSSFSVLFFVVVFKRVSSCQWSRLHGGPPSLGLSGFSPTRRSPGTLDPACLLCSVFLYTELSVGMVFDDSLTPSHITSNLLSSSEGRCQVLS